MEVLREGESWGNTTDRVAGVGCSEVTTDVASTDATRSCDATAATDARVPVVSKAELKRERQRTYSKQYYQKNREAVLVSQKSWYVANLERNRTYRKRYRDANRQIMREQSKAWRETTRGRAIALVHSARSRAVAKGVPFSITPATVETVLALGVCQMTGLPFSYEAVSDTQMNPFAPSLDREDPKNGYTVDNVRVVITAFNMGRGQWGDDLFIKVAKAFMAKREEVSEMWDYDSHDPSALDFHMIERSRSEAVKWGSA